MTALSETSVAQAWLEKFDDIDRESAIDLLNEVLLVSRYDFVIGLHSLLDEVLGIQSGSARKVALYAERPIKKVFGNVPSFFPKARRGRAEGTGMPPIVVDPRDQEVGSEGVVANIITDYCRRNRSVSFSHPGPTKMRKDKVRAIVILTDFIGSGQRITTMLESFRYVATLRSWRSYRLIRFVVLAYSGTTEGIGAVRSHKLKPEVRILMGCPTIHNTFTGARRKEVEELCRAHPKGHSEPLGYRGSAALIAFAHGCPNNVPPILHSRKSGWKPLFHGRSTTNSSAAFLPTEDNDLLDQRAHNLLGIREARRALNCYENKDWISAMLILAAARSGLHTMEQISSRTHIEINIVNKIVSLAIKAHWLDDNSRLTRLGNRELARLRRRRRRAPVLANDSNNFYYPTQLRAS